MWRGVCGHRPADKAHAMRIHSRVLRCRRRGACRACAVVGVARRASLVHSMVPCLACACRAARRARPPGGWGGACAGAAVACGVRQVGDALQQPRTRWKASGSGPAVGPRGGVASWVWGVGREVSLGLGAASACGRATAGGGGRALAPQRSGEQRATGAGAVRADLPLEAVHPPAAVHAPAPPCRHLRPSSRRPGPRIAASGRNVAV